MQTQDFQKLCTEIVNKIDQQYKIKRDSNLNFIQLLEEIGELAREINMPTLRNKEVNQNNLNNEFADVILLLANLATIHNVDLEKAVKEKIMKLKERHGIDIEN